MVVQRSGGGLLFVDGVVVANLVQLVGGDAGLDVRSDHA